MAIPDWRDNQRITILTSAQVESLDRARLEIGREKDLDKRAKLIEKFKVLQSIYANDGAAFVISVLDSI